MTRALIGKAEPSRQTILEGSSPAPARSAAAGLVWNSLEQAQGQGQACLFNKFLLPW
jgi:hypothetical protein